jgi:hypothetical protein
MAVQVTSEHHRHGEIAPAKAFHYTLVADSIRRWSDRVDEA